jgi:hypothetical protein
MFIFYWFNISAGSGLIYFLVDVLRDYCMLLRVLYLFWVSIMAMNGFCMPSKIKNIPD